MYSSLNQSQSLSSKSSKKNHVIRFCGTSLQNERVFMRQNHGSYHADSCARPDDLVLFLLMSPRVQGDVLWANRRLVNVDHVKSD